MEKIYVTRSSMPDFGEYIDEIKELWNTHQLTNMGAKHHEFEKLLENYLGVPDIELLVNGHMAIEMTLQALNLQGEVITTPYTFASTTHAIVRNGLEPVFCDIKADDFTIDPSKIENLITDRTCAILPVHVYGNICDVEAIEKIARKYELKVVYDAAHAFGETYKGKNVAQFGDASCFSFHATKVFNTIEGGAVSYRNKNIGAALYDLKNFGIHGPEEVTAVGSNAKMNEFCAAMGICNLRHIDENIRERHRVAKIYREMLSDVEGLQLNLRDENTQYNYAYFPIIIDEKKFGSSREEVYEALFNEGIVTRKYFYPLTNSFEAFHGKYDVLATPVALHVSKRVLVLPIYPELEDETVKRIASILLKCKK